MTATVILNYVLSQCWAIRRDALHSLINSLSSQARSGIIPTPEAVEAAKGRLRATSGKVAVLPVRGPLLNRADDWAEFWTGGLSMERLTGWLNAAVGDKSVGAIVLDVDSPGGTVSGLAEAASAIRAAKEVKPVYAVANSDMASAAYYLGSQATEVIASPSAMVGSIGTVWPHIEMSEALKAEGVKVTVIKAGQNKWSFNPYEPLSESGRAEMQSIVDGYYAEFIRDVSKGRNISRSKVESDFGGGSMFKAEDALSRGMVDRIATLGEVVGRLLGTDAGGGAKAESETWTTENKKKFLDLAAL